MNNVLGTDPERDKYYYTAEDLPSKWVAYLRYVNYPLLEGVGQQVLVRY
jgi:hypothetical protein